MKEIKDYYLHLYLGCEFYLSEAKNDFVHIDRPMGVWDLSQNEKYEDRIIKPILRPLSDMTEEEQSEVNFRDINAAWAYTNEEVWSFEQVRYLLSKHFDLFGLIESGLAIDSTTIK